VDLKQGRSGASVTFAPPPPARFATSDWRLYVFKWRFELPALLAMSGAKN
jgi:hypothetical protein